MSVLLANALYGVVNTCALAQILAQISIFFHHSF